ncbi:MAG TPA: zinc-binding dehydrogenase, partial [Mycobacterium sp.]|nr:zinc-binding dehydrogenase [Mycobacterium sp.]
VAVCGECRWCNSGMEYICDMGAQVMVPGMPTDGTFRHHTADGRDLGHLSKVGAFSKHTVVSTDSIIKIDAHLPLLPMALLSCGVPTGYGSAENRAKVKTGDTVVVIGVGGIGSAAVQGARINGAAHIIAVDPVEFKRKSALGFGATHTAVDTDEAASLLRDLTHGVMADSVVVSPSLISEHDVQPALSLTRKGGTCVLTGMSASMTGSIAINLQEFTLWNKTIAGTVYGSCNPRVDVARFARLYEAGLLQLDEMITRRYSLDDINEGYRDLLNGEVIRGVIDFSLS